MVTMTIRVIYYQLTHKTNSAVIAATFAMAIVKWKCVMAVGYATSV